VSQLFNKNIEEVMKRKFYIEDVVNLDDLWAIRCAYYDSFSPLREENKSDIKQVAHITRLEAQVEALVRDSKPPHYISSKLASELVQSCLNHIQSLPASSCISANKNEFIKLAQAFLTPPREKKIDLSERIFDPEKESKGLAGSVIPKPAAPTANILENTQLQQKGSEIREFYGNPINQATLNQCQFFKTSKPEVTNMIKDLLTHGYREAPRISPSAKEHKGDHELAKRLQDEEFGCAPSAFSK
jgi:hypothetical protein